MGSCSTPCGGRMTIRTASDPSRPTIMTFQGSGLEPALTRVIHFQSMAPSTPGDSSNSAWCLAPNLDGRTALPPGVTTTKTVLPTIARQGCAEIVWKGLDGSHLICG